MVPKNPIIFESPDGGKTVYTRNFGSPNQYQYTTAAGEMQTVEEMLEDILWRAIRKEAKNDKELQKILDRAKILYYLKKKDGG